MCTRLQCGSCFSDMYSPHQLPMTLFYLPAPLHYSSLTGLLFDVQGFQMRYILIYLALCFPQPPLNPTPSIILFSCSKVRSQISALALFIPIFSLFHLPASLKVRISSSRDGRQRKDCKGSSKQAERGSNSSSR
jgi:hypothetical protein